MKTQTKQDVKLPGWIIAIVILIFIFEFLSGDVFSLIASLIGVACGMKNKEWAIEIKKSYIFAFIIGFLFGFLGLLGYWIYYKRAQKNENVQNKSGGNKNAE